MVLLKVVCVAGLVAVGGGLIETAPAGHQHIRNKQNSNYKKQSKGKIVFKLEAFTETEI